MRILVTVASKHGGSAEIGERIAETLVARGHAVDVLDPMTTYDVEPYEAFVIGSAVYIGRWLDAGRLFVLRHAGAIGQRPVWLFSSGPLGSVTPGLVKMPTDVRRLVELTGAREHRIFAGRLAPDAIGLAERAIVRLAKAPYGDYRNWIEVAEWACSIAEALEAVPAS